MKQNKLPNIGTKSILVFFALALIVSGSIFVTFDPERTFQPTIDIDFTDTHPADDIVVNGKVDIDTYTKDLSGNIIRHYDAESALTGSLLDPASDSEVQSYAIDVNWQCSGTGIDWTTLKLTGQAHVKYIGIGYYGQAKDGSTIDFANVDKGVDDTGTQTIEHTDLDSLVPDSLPDFYFEDDPKNIKPRRIPVSVPQRTAEKHAVIFKFTFEFTLSVIDIDGNPHSSIFSGTVELRLTWAGSTFSVEWNNQETTESEDVVSTPDTPTGADIDSLTSVDTVLDKDMTKIESDEFVNLRATDLEADTLTASLFGGGVTEDIGVILIALGVGLLVIVFLAPNTLKIRRR
ncbi:MAG: hypothetical protein ACTSWQ_00470 [Candidatus Thorarchaeota archaeon]